MILQLQVVVFLEVVKVFIQESVPLNALLSNSLTFQFPVLPFYGDLNGLPFARKPIRTISGVFELIGRFEFDFRRCGIFFERFEFWVCSNFNHTQCGRTCACAVACL